MNHHVTIADHQISQAESLVDEMPWSIYDNNVDFWAYHAAEMLLLADPYRVVDFGDEVTDRSQLAAHQAEAAMCRYFGHLNFDDPQWCPRCWKLIED